MAKYMVCYGSNTKSEVFETDSFQEAVKLYAVCCERKDSAVFTDLEKKKIIAQCVISLNSVSVSINPDV